MNRLCVILASLLPLTLGACKAGAVGDAIEPATPTAADAMGEIACSDDQSRAEPLMVDWGSADRADLEIAMRDGVVVASYDCNSFRVLTGCRVEGGYSFAGVSRKEDVIQVSGQGELHANFPLGWANLGAGLDRDSTIDIALVTVGKHRTPATQVSRPQLSGDCDGATHFVRSAFVGAFAVGTGTRGHVGAVADVFKLGEVGASSTSEHKALNRDGDLAACGAANPLDPNPPPQCQSLLRVELVALHDGVGESDADPDPEGGLLSNVCTAEGYVWDGAKCVHEEAAKGYRCAPENAAQCRAQCELGNADSCHNLAVLTQAGKAGLTADADAAQVLHLKACEGGNLASCRSSAHGLDWRVEPERAIALMERACDGGDAVACRSIGHELLRGKLLPEDAPRGAQFLSRACSMHEHFACPILATHLYTTSNQPEEAIAVLESDCKRGSSKSCGWLVGWFTRCKDGRVAGMRMDDFRTCEAFTLNDPARGMRVLERACAVGSVGACIDLANRYETGNVVAVDLDKARELFESACSEDWGACMRVAQFYEEGKGVPVDLNAAYAAYAAGCDDPEANGGTCFHAARLAQTLAKDVDYRARLEQSCERNWPSRQGCMGWAKLLEDEKRVGEAKAVYSTVCHERLEASFCDAYVRLGGELAKDFAPRPRKADRTPDEF